MTRVKEERLAEISKIARITRYEYLYDCGLHYKLIGPKFIRAPEEGLRVIFGNRPWLWQQYALLKYEERVQFSLGHKDDFEKLDPVTFAEDFWNVFLTNFERKNPDHPLFNKALKEHTDTHQKLKEHILKPFVILDDIRTGDGWEDFDQENAFSYLSILGAGFLIPVLCSLVQVSIFAVLVVDTYVETKQVSDRKGYCPVGTTW